VTVDNNDSGNSCSVKTVRPDGRVLMTQALIRAGPARGRNAGRILWGSAFALEISEGCPEKARWLPLGGGKSFQWFRDKDAERPSFHKQQCSRPDANKGSCSNTDERSNRVLVSDRSAWRSSMRARTRPTVVWRAVQKRRDDKEQEEEEEEEQERRRSGTRRRRKNRR